MAVLCVFGGAMTERVTPIEQKTRIRGDHNTAGAIITYVNPGDKIEIEPEAVRATAEVKMGGKVYRQIGDVWGEVVTINGLGPVVQGAGIALTNMGQVIGQELPDEPEVPVASEYISYHDKMGNEGKFIPE